MSETLIVEFGKGEVGVMRTSEQGEDFESGIAFVRQEAHPIGEVVPGRIGKTTDEVGSFLRFHFSNRESLQVVINDLIAVHASMRAVEQPRALDACPRCAGTGYVSDSPFGTECLACGGTGKRQ